MKTLATLWLSMLVATVASATNLTVTGFEITTSDDVQVCISTKGELLYIAMPDGELKRDDAGRIVRAGSVRIEYESDGTIGKIGDNAIKRDMVGSISSIGEFAIKRDPAGAIVGIGEAVIQRASNNTIEKVVGDARIRPVLTER